jgi:hypothetical protein
MGSFFLQIKSITKTKAQIKNPPNWRIFITIVVVITDVSRIPQQDLVPFSQDMELLQKLEF